MDNNLINNNSNNNQNAENKERLEFIDLVNKNLKELPPSWFFKSDHIKPSNNPYANDYDKAFYYPVSDMIIGHFALPVFRRYNTFVIGKRGFFSPKWDFWAKAKWPGFINSFIFWPGRYKILWMLAWMILVFSMAFIFIIGLAIVLS